MRALAIDGDGHSQCDVLSSALPSGAATESTLSTIAGDTTSLDGKVTACNTGAVVVSSSALPTGAATQTTLASIDTRIADSINAGSTVYGDGASGRIVSYSFGRDSGGGQMKAIAIDTDGHQQIDVLSSALPSGASTSALQGTGNTSLASIDGKVILPSALTGSGNLKVAIEEGQITGFATSTLQGTANGHLSTIAGDTTSLDGKVTACNTGAVVISSSALPSGASTSALQGTANGHLSTIAGDTTSLDTKITSGADSTLSSAQQVVAYGANGSNLHPLKVTNSGVLKTEETVPWSTSTLMTAQAIAGGANADTSTLDLGSDIHPPKDVMFFVTNSASKSCTFTVEVSHNGSDFFNFQPTAAPSSARAAFYFSSRQHANVIPVRYMRLNVVNGTADSTNITVVAGHYSE